MAEHITADKVAYAEESITDAWHEAIPLMCANHAEVGGLPAEHFDPQLSSFQQLDAAGVLRVYTLRVLGAIVGYAVFVLSRHLTYPSRLVATAHVVYVRPENRGRRAIRFLLWVKAQLKAEGAHYWGLQCPVSNDWSGTLRMLGLKPMETFYVGELA